MASIPLPALGVQAPPQPDTLGNFSKLLAIKQQQAMAPLQQQEARQQVQSGAVDLQQKQLQMKAQQTLQAIGPNHITRDDKGRPTGYDYDGLMNDATSKGIPPAMLAPIQEMHKKAVDTVLAQTNANKGMIENQLSINKQAYEQMEGIKSLTDPAQRQQAWQEFGQWAQKNGMDTSQAPPQAPDNDTLTAREAVLGMHGQALADAKNLAQEKEASARANEATVNTQKTQQEMALGTGPMAESKYRNILMNEKLGRPVSAEDQAWKSAYEKSKTLVPAFNFKLQANGVTGNGGVETVDTKGNPRPIADVIKDMGPKGGTVQAIIDGRQKAPASFAQKSPYWQDVMNKVYQIDPQFNEQRAELRKEYTVGKKSGEINAINTAMGHVGVLGDAIAALDNGNIPLLNKIANGLGVQVGADAKTTFQTIVHRVGPELSKAYIGAGGSAGERGADEADFDPSKGTQQLKSNVAITAKLLRSKIASLENQWDQNKAPGMKSFEDQFIMPEAKAQLDKWSPKSSAQSDGGAQHTPGAKAGLQEGATGTGSDGQKYIVKGGVWVRQ